MLKSKWIFSTRNINGKWCRFDNLPIFCPIAVGGELRFKDVILENVTSLSWPEFARYYRQSVDCNEAKLEVLPQCGRFARLLPTYQTWHFHRFKLTVIN